MPLNIVFGLQIRKFPKLEHHFSKQQASYDKKSTNHENFCWCRIPIELIIKVEITSEKRYE